MRKRLSLDVDLKTAQQTLLVLSCIVARASQPSRMHKFALDVREGFRQPRLAVVNMISHYLPLKSPANTKRRQTTPESTVESGSTNDDDRADGNVPMPSGPYAVCLPVPDPATGPLGLASIGNRGSCGQACLTLPWSLFQL